MRSARLELSLDTGLWALPPEGVIAVWRPARGDDLSALPRARVLVITSFRPDLEHFAARGFAVAAEGEETVFAPGAHAAALICLPKARDHARALLAAAVAALPAGAPVAVDGQKTDGIEPALKELRGLAMLSEVLSKAHGKIAVFPATSLPPEWVARPKPVEGGFLTRPGVFSAEGPDRASRLLADALPAKLGPKVVDLGAGWGYLSQAVLARAGVKRLDLVEAEHAALLCAREVILDPRARFHWADALTFRPENLAETVVMNPPFHQGRTADPALGIAFIAAARRMLAPDGALWLVANRHLPYDAALREHFLEVTEAGGDNGFRVICAIKPRRIPR